MYICFKFFHASAKAPNDYWNYFHHVTFSPFSQFKAKLFVFLDFLFSLDLSIRFIWACHIYETYRFLFFSLSSFFSSFSILSPLHYMKKEARRLYHMFPEKPMEPLTSEEWKGYNQATKCHICFKPFGELNPKVRDHCHYTGKYRGPAHRNYNLSYKIPSYIPIIFHNLSRYDAHLFIRELGKETNKIRVITENKEKYISFTSDLMVDEYQDKGKTKEKKFNFDSLIVLSLWLVV